MESSWTWPRVFHRHKKHRALSPRHVRTMSAGNNGGEMQGKGWSFLLWQASKQPAGWIAVIGVKCPQLAVHWQSCSARSSVLSLRRPCGRGGGGQVQVWDSADSLMWCLRLQQCGEWSGGSLTKSIAISSLGRGVGCRWWKGRGIFSTVPSNGFFSVRECVCWICYLWERELL